MHSIRVGNHYIGDNNSCFIVAEIGISHNGEISLAKKMIDVAKNCGVDAVKFQTFKAEEFISNSNQTYTYHSQGEKVTESMLEMFKKYEFSEKEWRQIFNYCKRKNIICLSTPQNASDLDFLLEIADLPIIKVGSDDLTNLPLMGYYASKNKPMIISAGMAYLSEIEDAVNIVREQQNNDIAVLHCVASYPTEPAELNLKKMITIKNTFDVVVGFSDHSIGSMAATTAVSMGAKIIEKHFTLDKNLPGPDHGFSADVKEFSELVSSVRCVEQALGSEIVEPTKKELDMRKIARRSIVVARDLPCGHKITEKDIAFKRPGTGLVPKFKNSLLGKITTQAIAKDTIITPDMMR